MLNPQFPISYRWELRIRELNVGQIISLSAPRNSFPAGTNRLSRRHIVKESCRSLVRQKLYTE